MFQNMRINPYLGCRLRAMCCDASRQGDFLCLFFGGLECVGHSFAYVFHVVFLRDVWIQTQRAALASRRATNLAAYHGDLEF
jgi:hypothetical protein